MSIHVHVHLVGSDSEEGHVRSRSSEGGSGEWNKYGGYGYMVHVHVVGMDVAGAEIVNVEAVSV